MKSAIFAASLLASLAVASPVMEKRYYVTKYVATVTDTVTVNGGAQPTQFAANANHFSWGGWQGQQQPSSEPAAVPTSSAPMQAWSSSAAAPSAVASAPSDLSSYAAPIITQHNMHRQNHSAPDIQWDDELTSIAAAIAASCVYAHNTQEGGGGYGQNIGAGSLPTEVDQMITNAMYNDEIGYYPGYGSEPDMSNFENWGHFSQIVWKSTTSVGCATQYCPGGLANVGSGVSPYFTVCNYKPAGNFGGEYAANVLAPKGMPVDIVS